MTTNELCRVTVIETLNQSGPTRRIDLEHHLFGEFTFGLADVIDRLVESGEIGVDQYGYMRAMVANDQATLVAMGNMLAERHADDYLYDDGWAVA